MKIVSTSGDESHLKVKVMVSLRLEVVGTVAGGGGGGGVTGQLYLGYTI